MIFANVAVPECLLTEKQVSSRDSLGGEESLTAAGRRAYLDGSGKVGTVDEWRILDRLFVHPVEVVLALLLFVESGLDTLHLCAGGFVVWVRLLEELEFDHALIKVSELIQRSILTEERHLSWGSGIVTLDGIRQRLLRSAKLEVRQGAVQGSKLLFLRCLCYSDSRRVPSTKSVHALSEGKF